MANSFCEYAPALAEAVAEDMRQHDIGRDSPVEILQGWHRGKGVFHTAVYVHSERPRRIEIETEDQVNTDLLEQHLRGAGLINIKNRGLCTS